MPQSGGHALSLPELNRQLKCITCSVHKIQTHERFKRNLVWHSKTCEYWGLALCQATEQQLNGEKWNWVYYLLVVTFFFTFCVFGFCFRVLAVILGSVFLSSFSFSVHTNWSPSCLAADKNWKNNHSYHQNWKDNHIYHQNWKDNHIDHQNWKDNHSYHQNWNDRSCECQEYLNWMSHWTFQEQECEMD